MNVKKILLGLLLLLTCQMAFCQSASSVFNDFRDKKHAEYVTVPKLVMSIAAAKVKDGNVAALLKEVDDVKVLKLSDCSKSVRKKFVKNVTALSSNGYDNFTGIKSGSEKDMTILVKQSGESIKEVVALVQNSSTCMGILISGDINAEDIAAIIGMVND